MVHELQRHGMSQLNCLCSITEQSRFCISRTIDAAMLIAETSTNSPLNAIVGTTLCTNATNATCGIERGLAFIRSCTSVHAAINRRRCCRACSSISSLARASRHWTVAPLALCVDISGGSYDRKAEDGMEGPGLEEGMLHCMITEAVDARRNNISMFTNKHVIRYTVPHKELCRQTGHSNSHHVHLASSIHYVC